MDKTAIAFLVRAKKATYAGNGPKAISSRPSSKDLHYAAGDLTYIDTYLGGAQFAGEEALWRDDVPFWAMNYMGKVVGEGFSIDFLKEALAQVAEAEPLRGPFIYRSGAFVYTCRVEGGFHWFNGHEEIHLDGLKVYECIFHGGEIK